MYTIFLYTWKDYKKIIHCFIHINSRQGFLFNYLLCSFSFRFSNILLFLSGNIALFCYWIQKALRKVKEHIKETPEGIYTFYIFKWIFLLKTQFHHQSVMTLYFNKLNCYSHQQFGKKLKKTQYCQNCSVLVSQAVPMNTYSHHHYFQYCFLQFAALFSPKYTSIELCYITSAKEGVNDFLTTLWYEKLTID